MNNSLDEQLVIYQRILDAAPDIIHIISADMKVILRNQRSRECFPNVKIGESCYRRLHNLDHPCNHCSVQRVFLDGQRHEHESIIHCLDKNKERVFHSTSSPIYDEKGKMFGALEILRDITGRKHLERKLEKTAEHLKRANRLKGLLFRMLRHDLGTPVGAILNTAEFLLEEPEQLGDLLEDIEDIHQCSSHILYLIRDVDVLSEVLNTSRLVFEDVDLSKLLAGLAVDFEPIMKQAGVEFVCRVPNGLVVKGLPVMKTVFENILANGVKYGSSGGRLELTAFKSDTGVDVEIMDYGPGVADKDKERIFQKFERLADDVPGTGLGLAIASETVGLLNGEISMKDNPKGGAVFLIRLPGEGVEKEKQADDVNLFVEKLIE